jgi:hypothetical protein
MDEAPRNGPPDRPLEGLGTFAWKVAIATVLAVIGVVVVLWWQGRGGAERDAAPRSSSPAVPPTSGVPAPSAVAPRVPPTSVATPQRTDGPDAVTPVGIDVERRHAAGELSEAQRRFEPCPGGDVRRVAWIDSAQRVRKLVGHRASGLVVKQWFDDAGRLREALVTSTSAGRAWTRRLRVDDRGAESIVDAPPGAVPDEPPPALVHSDPSAAFFAGAGCER